jgi:DtxR family Mn-dependent transcriptional regulator
MTTDEVRTKAVDDLLKTVYELQQQVDPVPTTLLAKSLNISAASVTDMIKRLAEARDDQEPVLEHRPYHGVRLTVRGEKIALEVIRHHRLIELYLVQKLGYTWDEVHAEADKLEHVISEKLEARIAAALGNPSLDPHGDPIPALDGSIVFPKLSLLSEMEKGESAIISRIVDQSVEALRYLSDLGLVPGAQVDVSERSPLGDMLTIASGGEQYAISTNMARMILVHLETDDSPTDESLSQG